jgi:CheY-like chemotaxis protein
VRCRVLVVEDSTLVTDALTILLESAGHEVRVAATVAEALALGRREPVDVLLLDLTLPDGHGLDVLHGLRGSGAAPAVAAALTGHDDPALTARCEAAGCRAVLLKPVPTRELLRLVADWGREAAGTRTAGHRAAASEPPL